MGRGAAQPRSTPPVLRLLDGRLDSLPPGRQVAWARLWPAWRNLEEWEDRVDADFGSELGEDMLVLWALLRFGGSRDLEGLLNELVTDDLAPTFGSSLMEDIVQVAFALGAAWAGSEAASAEPPVRSHPAPRVLP